MIEAGIHIDADKFEFFSCCRLPEADEENIRLVYTQTVVEHKKHSCFDMELEEKAAFCPWNLGNYINLGSDGWREVDDAKYLRITQRLRELAKRQLVRKLLGWKPNTGSMYQTDFGVSIPQVLHKGRQIQLRLIEGQDASGLWIAFWDAYALDTAASAMAAFPVGELFAVPFEKDENGERAMIPVRELEMCA